MTRILSIEEHRPLTDSQLFHEVFDNDDTLWKRFPDASNAIGKNLLGCYVEGWPTPVPKAGFHVGITWLKEGQVALQVCPKISNIDFLTMFMTCLKCRDNVVQDKIMQIYGIDFKKPAIDMNGLHLEITPFIIIHFLSLLESIIKKGLKHNYVFEEDNLQGKLRGKLVFSQHFKKNVLNQRLDMNYCRYQEYSVDCTENKILKKALTFAEGYLQRHKLNLSKELTYLIHQGKNVFAEVNENCTAAEIERFRVNPLFKEYARAISVAKLILKRFGYDVQRIEKQSNMIPPFWIDMPLLFETYILGLLTEKYGSGIKYHISTHGNEIDFGKPDEQMIIDTKYIYHWDDMVNHDNIRQLSGYARNKQIRRKLLGYVNETDILPCMILYPSVDGIEKFLQEYLLDEPCKEIETYLKFHKLGIKLPEKTINIKKEVYKKKSKELR